MAKLITAQARLDVLLQWLNRADDLAEARHATEEFVQSFDGSVGAGHVEVVARELPTFMSRKKRKTTDTELSELGTKLRIMFEQGFGDATLADLSFPATSLRFAVRSTGRRKPGWRTGNTGKRVLVGGTRAQRAYREAGAYVLQVHGETGELVLFLAAHLLTQPGMVAVHQCPSPGCQHFIVTALAARGRPRIFCSNSCRVRYAEQRDQQRRRRRTP